MTGAPELIDLDLTGPHDVAIPAPGLHVHTLDMVGPCSCEAEPRQGVDCGVVSCEGLSGVTVLHLLQ